MKKNIFLLLVLFLAGGLSYAGEIGYVDYSVIYKNLDASKQYQKQIDTKAEQIRTYNKTTQAKLNAQTTSEERASVTKSRRAELIKMEREYIDLRYKQEAYVKAKVKTAAQNVLAQKKLDMIVDSKYRVAGGVDCTQEILKAIK